MGKRRLFSRKSIEFTQQDQQLLDELQSIVHEISPDDVFKDRLAEHLLNAEPPLKTIYPDFGNANENIRAESKRNFNVLYGKRQKLWTTIVASVLLVLMVMLVVPPLRALAEGLLDVILDRTASDLIVFEYYQPDAVTTGYPVGDGPYVFFDSIDNIATYVDYEVLAPSAILEEPPREIVYVTNNNMVSLVYRYPNGGWLEIQQQPIANMVYWRNLVGASAEIEQVELLRGDETIVAEYVHGWWNVYSPSNSWEQPITGIAEWVDEMPVRRLRWFEDDMVYEIQIWEGMPRTPDVIPLESMIQIAESLR